MENSDKNSIILFSPLFVLLGALIIKDGIYLLKGNKYPPPFLRKFRRLFRTREEATISSNDPDEQRKMDNWVKMEGYKNLVSGIF